jgi:hypothetical protein
MKDNHLKVASNSFLTLFLAALYIGDETKTERKL